MLNTTPYTPDRLAPPNAGADCHRLYATFLSLIPQYACHGAAICTALQWSDTMTAGFVIEQSKKDMAQVYFAAHLLAVGAIAALTDQARAVSAVKGTPPAIPAGDVNSTEWLKATIWGQSFLGMVKFNARLGVIVA